MPKLLDTTALGQSVQASKDYTDQRISGVELNVQQATEEQVQDILDDVFGGTTPEVPINYVTFDSDEPRTITPAYTNAGVALQYSLDSKTWVDIASKAITPSAKTIYMRGQATGTKSLYTSIDDANKWIFSGDATNKLRVTGNLNYLLCDTLGDTIAPTTLAKNCYCIMFYDCTALITAPELPAATLATECYRLMFNGCTSLVTAPELSATTLMLYCYNGMFSGCTSLITAPELPATTLAEYCYGDMFSGCTSLINAPELPAMTLIENCYYAMFINCKSLVSAPELSATSLATSCYSAMFQGCTSLVSAPELPATTLANSCYWAMFQNCTSLSSVKIHATTNLTVTYALDDMLYGVKNTGILTCKTALTTALLPTPPGWTRVNF